MNRAYGWEVLPAIDGYFFLFWSSESPLAVHSLVARTPWWHTQANKKRANAQKNERTNQRTNQRTNELLYHLYQNHVADSPNCPCGVIETPEHYFFASSLHHIAREELTAELFQLQLTPTLNTVLFGDAPSGNLPELVIAVEKCITTTQRFTNYVKFTGLKVFSPPYFSLLLTL